QPLVGAHLELLARGLVHVRAPQHGPAVDDRRQQHRARDACAGPPHGLDDLLDRPIEQLVVIRLEADPDLLIGGQGHHALLRDLRDDARPHRPPALPDRKPQLLLHRHRLDQLDRHRHVVAGHHHLPPPPPPPSARPSLAPHWMPRPAPVRRPAPALPPRSRSPLPARSPLFLLPPPAAPVRCPATDNTSRTEPKTGCSTAGAGAVSCSPPAPAAAPRPPPPCQPPGCPSPPGPTPGSPESRPTETGTCSAAPAPPAPP